MKTPTLHFDHTMKKFPEGRYLYEMVRDLHKPFSDTELKEGTCSQALDEFDGTSRITNYLMMLYDRFGQNTYVIGPKVQELFRRTNLSKVTRDMIEPPQPAFYIGLNDCPWRIWGGRRTQWHNLTGVYVAFSKSVNTNAEGAPREYGIHFALWGAANERSFGPTDDALLWYSINLEEMTRQGADLETFFAKHRVMLANEEDHMMWQGGDPIDPDNLPFIPDTTEKIEEQRRTLTNILRLALNVCLYMSSDDPDLNVKDWSDEAAELRKKIATKKSSGKRKKMERRLANLPKTRLVYVGPMFEELPEEKATEQREHQGGTHAPPVEHGVSPHWQRYWVGSGDERKVKWRLKGMYVRGAGKADRTITKIRE